jgi:hypothetical protein
MKILCFINHFYGASNNFTGGSTSFNLENSNKRKKYVENTINSLKQLGKNVDISVCGITNKSLVPIDISFNHIENRPIELIYESLNKLKDYINSYDYFVNIEDDLILPKETFERIVDISKSLRINEAIIPNRFESDLLGREYCVDLYAIPIWEEEEKKINDNIFKIPLNPHSGILILSKDRLNYSFEKIDLLFRGITIGRELESAFAHFHSPFQLYRPFNPINYLKIYHQDKFKHSPNYLSDYYPYFPFGYKYQFQYKLEKYIHPKIVYLTGKIKNKIFKKN